MKTRSISWHPAATRDFRVGILPAGSGSGVKQSRQIPESVTTSRAGGLRKVPERGQIALFPATSSEEAED
jgi:hypothetical protein